MRLIRCHIENFGKLHDCTIDFAEGATIICEENGWGKSTFAAFVRAMFYGLDGKTRKTIEGNERMRYAPWQGGVFGGQLTFEVGEKQYVVTRTFHEQEEFELRDAKTNLISNDYSSNLGEEIFKVDRESFMRTVFIGQADCETAVTDDVNAKIGNLSDNLNDMNNFESINKSLKELLNSLTPTRKTGSISQRKNEITDLERKVNVGNGIPNALQSIQEKHMEELQKYGQIKAKLDIVQKEQIRVSKLQAILAKREQWENLKQEMKDSRRKFYDEVPSMEGVRTTQLNLSEMEKASERIATYEMTEGEKEQLASLEMVFDKEVPEEQEIVQQLNKVQRLGNLRTELLKEQVIQAEATKQQAEQEKQKRTSMLTMSGVIILLGAIIGVVGVVAPMLFVTVIGVVVALVGVVMAVSGLKTREVSQKSEDDICVRIEEEAAQLQKSVGVFLGKFGIYAAEDAYANQLYELKNQCSKYVFLKEKKQKWLHARKEFEQKQNEIKDFLMKYGFESANNLQIQLLNIRDDLQTYMDACKKLEAFEKTTDVSELNVDIQGSEGMSLSELNQQILDLTEERDESYQRIDGYNIDLEELQRQNEEWEENKIRLEELRQLQEQETQKFHYIKKVQEYLGKAKENITNRYSAPILESFKTYYEMIAVDGAKDYHIDANINLTKDEQGKQRDTNTLSSGYRDLIGVCLRVALVDAMYKEERPILIMDDPFTNLDDEKMERAKEFLKYVAEKYQVIYFTCSEARK